MTALILNWIANSLAIYAVAYLVRGVDVASFRDALIAGAILTAINAIVKPVLVILTLPLTVLTLGIFYFFVTAFCLWLVSKFYSGFMIHGFFTTILAAILVGIFSAFIQGLLSKATR
ncbi:MAG TPA: phage holin family protein [Vicinamibacterales bacterium]|nr:phage holin family protein [Vicinamibacterales bacterium]